MFQYDQELKFHNTSLQLFDFLFLPCYAAVKDIICANLLVKFFRQLRRVKILGVSHLTKELFAPAGKFYPTKILENRYIRVAKTSRFLMFIVRSGVPE